MKNSVKVFVRDAVGDLFLYTVMRNDPELVKRQKAFARSWIDETNRKGGRFDRHGKRLPMAQCPCMPCTVVVEEYDDTSQPD